METQSLYLVQKVERIPSGPPGTRLFPTAFLPEPGGPPRPSGGWEQKWPRFPGPRKGRGCGRALRCGRPARVSPPVPKARASGFRQGEGPWQEETVSGQGRSMGAEAASMGLPPLAPHRPRKDHPPSTVQAPAPPAPCLLSDPPRARHPRAFAQSFLTWGYSFNFCFCTLPPLPLWTTPSLRSDWVSTISLPTPSWSPAILAFSIICAILTLPTGRLLKGKGDCPT